KSYQAFDHGYATTIHKSQGATVDRAFVMASSTLDRHLTYVAMTRHRDSAHLYAGRDELKDMKVLTASIGRSGAKETTLDYLDTFAARRGIGEAPGIGIGNGIAVDLSSAMGERVRSPSTLQAGADIATQRQERVLEGAVEKVAPLVPALASYSRSVDDIAREK